MTDAAKIIEGVGEFASRSAAAQNIIEGGMKFAGKAANKAIEMTAENLAENVAKGVTGAGVSLGVLTLAGGMSLPPLAITVGSAMVGMAAAAIVTEAGKALYNGIKSACFEANSKIATTETRPIDAAPKALAATVAAEVNFTANANNVTSTAVKVQGEAIKMPATAVQPTVPVHYAQSQPKVNFQLTPRA